MHTLELLHNTQQAGEGDHLRVLNGPFKSDDSTLSLPFVKIQKRDQLHTGPLGTSTTNAICGTWNPGLCDLIVLPATGIETFKIFGLASLTHWTTFKSLS